MSKETIYVQGPNGCPYQLSGSYDDVDPSLVVSEEDALAKWAQMEADDTASNAVVAESKTVALGGAHVALVTGVKMTAEQAIALGARPVAKGEGK